MRIKEPRFRPVFFNKAAALRVTRQGRAATARVVRFRPLSFLPLEIRPIRPLYPNVSKPV